MAKPTKLQKDNTARLAKEKHVIKSELLISITPLDRDDVAEYTLTYRDDGEHGGYNENHIDVSIGKDGHIHFCGDPESEQVYLYPQQVKHLKKILKGVK